jgi:ribosomal protein S12 methylthiotransferase accessory factor
LTQHDRRLTQRLAAAADALLLDCGLDDLHQDERGLLRYLQYDDEDTTSTAARVRILRAAGWLSRLFLLPAPDAPGLVFFGGEADPAGLGADLRGMPIGSMSGTGMRPQRAFEACVGEAVEYLSQFVRPTDPIDNQTLAAREPGLPQPMRRFVGDVLSACDVASDRSIGWLPVRDLATGDASWVPADLCLRRPDAQRDFTPPLKLSTGCAAGATADSATLHGLLELIERDAAALWWRGGRRGRPIAADGETGLEAAGLVAALRRGKDARRTWLLDITTDLGIPVVAAISATADGFGFAFGLGCRLSLAAAAGSAILELCQLELAPHVVAAKRLESGDEALGEADLRHLRRGTLVDTNACELTQPAGRPREADPSPAPTGAADAVRCIVERLAAQGVPTFALDLTRPTFDIPVIRVFAPGLQLDPTCVVTERLGRTIRQTGGGAQHTGGLSLL